MEMDEIKKRQVIWELTGIGSNIDLACWPWKKFAQNRLRC